MEIVETYLVNAYVKNERIFLFMYSLDHFQFLASEINNNEINVMANQDNDNDNDDMLMKKQISYKGGSKRE